LIESRKQNIIFFFKTHSTLTTHLKTKGLKIIRNAVFKIRLTFTCAGVTFLLLLTRIRVAYFCGWILQNREAYKFP